MSEDGPSHGVEVAEVLTRGEMTVHGRIPDSSNATLLVTCALGGKELLAVYKPGRGERPLWDFPSGLWRREVASYELSAALGWDIVPETVRRDEAPFGPGSVQRFVPEDGESHYFTLLEEPRWHPVLRLFAAFDVLANNADRKSGHVLLAEERLWAIDNGLTFNTEPKLRTVIWDFAGEELPAEAVADLARLRSIDFEKRFGDLLEKDELVALARRVGALAERPCLPGPHDPAGWRHYPWPLV